MPEITPPDDMMRPGGSDPPVTDHEATATLPESEAESAIGVIATPAGEDSFTVGTVTTESTFHDQVADPTNPSESVTFTQT
jgi:hypothetical protein